MEQNKKKCRKKKVRRSSENRPKLFKTVSFKPHINFGTHTIKILVIITAVVMLLLCAFLYIVKTYTVDKIIVEGSTHYSTEEINRMVIGDGFLAKNSLLLSLKYRNKEIKDVPFADLRLDYLLNLYCFGKIMMWKIQGIKDEISGSIVDVKPSGKIVVQAVSGQLCECDIKEIKLIDDF